MQNPLSTLWKIFCRSNIRCYQFDIFITRNNFHRINTRKYDGKFLVFLLSIICFGLYFLLFYYGRNSSYSHNYTYLDNPPDCTLTDVGIGKEQCLWNIDTKSYRHTFFSPLHHVQIDLYNFQCFNGIITLSFDLSYYSKKWFVNQQIELITNREDICISTMTVCEILRCDRWKPIGHVQSVFHGLSNVIVIRLGPIMIEIRLFEKMFAYRANLVPSESMNSITMQTKFNISKNSNNEQINGDAFMDGGEETGFTKFDINDQGHMLASTWARKIQHLPWTLDLHTNNDRIVTSITEVCNFGNANARMSFNNYDYSLRSGLLLRITYQYKNTRNDHSNNGLQWIAWLLADSPKRLADLAGFPGLLCPSPSTNEDFSWIHPGKVVRDMALSTITGKSLMDFAQFANLHYILLDAGYYGDEYNHTNNPLRPLIIPRENLLDIRQLVQYGKSLSKPIGVLLYVNDIVLSKGREMVENIAKTFKSWGVAGVKMGFVHSKRQIDMERIIENIQIFGREQLIVNIHDNFRDFYLSRTYPYLLSVEGISGDEHSRNPVNHALILPFTRLLAGRADHTFTLDWKRLETKKQTIMFQISLPFLLYNGLQHLYWYRDCDSLLRLGLQSPLNLWAELPTEYEKSIFLNGDIGVYAEVARQDKQGRWFLIYITTIPKSVTISLDFLSQPISNFTLTIYEDIEQSYLIQRHLLPKVKIRRCQINDELRLDLMANSAFIIVFDIRSQSNLDIC